MTNWNLPVLAAFLTEAQGPVLAGVAVVGEMQLGNRTDARAGVCKNAEDRAIA